ncbi:MAG: type 1 glutamine amidotransferase, partial [Phycisphaerales bacterium]|nr:type 1 glutamine amidotransferase [Phycisphaerales bacterium]
MIRPCIGLTADAESDRYFSRRSYADAVAAAGGLPVILPPVACAAESVRRCDAIVLTGGDDPIMEAFGRPTHPQATTVDPARQAFELALLRALDADADKPVLGICLGMQMMALHAGGDLHQHLPETLPTHAEHWGRMHHAVRGSLGSGTVLSHHRQAVADAGRLAVVASAPDGVIEAVADAGRRFYLGVQWHPERT